MTDTLRITRVRIAEVAGVSMGEGLVTPWSRRLHTHRSYIVARIDTDAGISGYTMDGDWEQDLPMTADDVRAVAERLVGRSVFDMRAHTRILSDTGLPGRYHFLEIALWDIVGKALGQPLFRLWGDGGDRVLAYASTVHYGKSVQERVQDCRDYYARGYRAVKLRLAEDTVDQDIAYVRAVREAVGADMEIMVDANQTSHRTPGPRVWDLERALETANRLHDLDATWLEAPLSGIVPEEDHAELVRRSPLAIAGGEGHKGLDAYWRILHRQTYGIVQPDPVVSGTVSTLLEIGDLAKAAGVLLACHHGKSGLGMLVALHYQAALGMTKYLETMDDPGHWNPEGFQVGFREPLLPRSDGDGNILCPTDPGLGADWDEEWLARIGLLD